MPEDGLCVENTPLYQCFINYTRVELSSTSFPENPVTEVRVYAPYYGEVAVDRHTNWDMLHPNADFHLSVSGSYTPMEIAGGITGLTKLNNL